MFQRHPPRRHFTQHQRHLCFDPRKAAIRIPNDVICLFFGGVRCVIGRDHVHHTALKRVPYRVSVFGLSHGGFTRMMLPNRS